MRKVKMLSISAGPEGTKHSGVVYPFDDCEAKMLVDGGYGIYETTAVNSDSINKAGKSPDVEEIKKLVEDSAAPVTPDLVKPVWGKK